MPDCGWWDLRGPVRTVDILRPSMHGSGHSIIEFRPDGAISRRWHKNPDGSEFTETHTYDVAGLLTNVQFETSSGPSHLWIYEYDSLGRLTRHLARGSDGNEHVLETYSYDTPGSKTKTHFPPSGANYHIAIEGSQTYYTAPNAATIVTSYNRADRPTETLFQDLSGALLSRVDFYYDESGNLTAEKQTLMVSPFPGLEQQLPLEQLAALQGLLTGPSTRCLHRYDAFGRRIETLRSLFGPLGNHRVTLSYNERGDLVAEISDDASCEYGFDDQGQLVDRPGHQSHSETRFLYEYDSRGNWTSKITEFRYDDHSDFSAASTESRTLTYCNPI